jgi:two-component system alkaline phosphatase synthesis response regulator PhoP
VSVKVLLVEDEELVGTMVRMNLEGEGYQVSWVRDGEDGLAAGLREQFDLILLDIALPGRDGLELLGELRSGGVTTPVLMLTARTEVKVRVEALDLGADDYLPKPFDVSELLARVRALVRRSQSERELPSDRIIRFGESYEINLDTREAVTNDGLLTLSEKESALMRMLVSFQGQPLPRADMIEEVWGMDKFPTGRTVDNFILRLRRWFEEEPERPRHILTVRGVGYRFVP